MIFTHTQATVLCRVDGMPIQKQNGSSWDDWVRNANNLAVAEMMGGAQYRLTPGATLAVDLAAICMGMGAGVEAYLDDVWEEAEFSDLDGDGAYRVPEEV